MVQKVLIFTIMIVASIATMGAVSDDNGFSVQSMIQKSATVFRDVADLF